MERETSLPVLTQDRLLGGRVRFEQPAHGYRAAIDPVLLAAAIPASSGESILDLGSGAGAATLCLAERVPGCTIVGIERDPSLVVVANANALSNGVANRVRFVAGDVESLPSEIANLTFDHAMANPPYLEARRADLRQRSLSGNRNAEIESGAGLEGWIDVLCRSVRRKGRITLIQRADRLVDILGALQPRAGDVAIFPLWPKPGSEARRVIVTARPGTLSPARLLSGLVLHGEDDDFSPDAKAVLTDGAPLTL